MNGAAHIVVPNLTRCSVARPCMNWSYLLQGSGADVCLKLPDKCSPIENLEMTMYESEVCHFQ